MSANIYEPFLMNDIFRYSIDEANKYLSRLGFHGISYNIKVQNLNKNHFYNQVFLETFVRDDMAKKCPIVRCVKGIKIGKPVTLFWSELPIRSKAEKEVMWARADFGMKDGITIINKRENNYVELIGLSSGASDSFRQRFIENRAAIISLINGIRRSIQVFSYPTNWRNPI